MVKRHVGSYGRLFHRLIVVVIVIVISGRHIVWFFRQISIRVLGKGWGNWLKLSDGKTRFVRGCPVMLARVCHFPSCFTGTSW